MAERDEIGRSMALARSALGAPPAARARVRARLAAGSLASSASPGAGMPARAAARFAAPSSARALVRALVWASLGLCAGYWLGFHRIGASLVEPSRTSRATSAAVEASPAPAAAASAPAARSSSVEEAAVTEPATTDTTADPALPEAGARTFASGSSGASAAATVRARPPSRATLPRRHSGSGASRVSRSESSLSAEIALLERAERAIRAGEGELALALIEQLDRDFPASSLRQERAAARVLARCTSARSAGPAERAAARARAEQFLADGSSVYAERVRELCNLDREN